MAYTPGWYPDPFGRFQQRYHNGEEWTEHVVSGGQQQVDPMGSSTVIPFALPATAVPGATGPAAPGATEPPSAPATSGLVSAAAPATATNARNPVVALLDGLGADARQRPQASLHSALAGIAGAIIATGITIAIGGGGFSRGRIAAAAIVILAAALAVRLLLVTQIELGAAAVGAAVLGIIGIGVAIVGNGNFDRGWSYLVIGVLFLAAWVLPGFHGRPLMLGLGLISLVIALAAATESRTARGLGGVTLLASRQGAVFLIAAALLLAAVWLLDRNGFVGVATPVTVAALVCSLLGVIGVVQNFGRNAEGKALLIVLVGLVVCIIGSTGQRRATTWYGAALGAIGLVALVFAIAEPTSTGSQGTALIVAGAILLAIPLVIRGVRANRTAGVGPPADLPPPPTV